MAANFSPSFITKPLHKKGGSLMRYEYNYASLPLTMQKVARLLLVIHHVS